METVAAICEECGAHFQVQLSSYDYESLSNDLTRDAGHNTDLYFAIDSSSLSKTISDALDKLGGVRKSPVSLGKLITHIAFRGYLDQYLEGPPFRNRENFARHYQHVQKQVEDALSQPPLLGAVLVTSGFGAILDPDSEWLDLDSEWLNPESKWIATKERWSTFIEDELNRSTQWSDMTEQGESGWLETLSQVDVLTSKYGIVKLNGKAMAEVLENARDERKFLWLDKLDDDYKEAFWKFDREEIDILELEEAMRDLVQMASTYAPESAQYRDAEQLVHMIFELVEDRKPTSWGDHRALLNEFRRLRWLVYALAVALAVVTYFVPAINVLVTDLLQGLFAAQK